MENNAIEERKEEYVEKAYQNLLENYEVKGQAARYAGIYRGRFGK